MSEQAAAYAQAQSEKAFLQQVLDYARLRGWRCYHPFDSRRSEPGFPDVIAVRGDELLAIELKRETGRLTPPQQDWLRALAAVRRVEAHLFRPSMWPVIEERLR